MLVLQPATGHHLSARPRESSPIALRQPYEYTIRILCLCGSIPAKGWGVAASGHLITSTQPKDFNSCFRLYSETRMWNVLGNYYHNIDSLRRAVFVIPVTAVQKQILDSLT